jgi:outer membrane immunogenic protein
MLRNVLLPTILIASAGSAFAADLPYRTAAPAPSYVAAAPMFTWSGFYAGLNAGAAWNNNSSLNTAGFVAPPAIFGGRTSDDDLAFTGGAQIGYNMQFGNIVAGVEADLNYMDRKSGSTGTFPALADVTPGFDDSTDFAVSQGKSSKWFGTVRGRRGFAFDRALIYATGGLAYGGKAGGSNVSQRDTVENATAIPFPPFPPILVPNGTFTTGTRALGSTGGSGSNIGWALGAGAEYAFTNSMSFKIEYMHVDLGSSSRTYTTLASTPGPSGVQTMTAGNRIIVRNENKFDVVRAGVNFRF